MQSDVTAFYDARLTNSSAALQLGDFGMESISKGQSYPLVQLYCTNQAQIQIFPKSPDLDQSCCLEYFSDMSNIPDAAGKEISEFSIKRKFPE